ncbi:hypothetical protein O181_007947 [Austropuccinia psidii MF-1]|uniref:Uncharacterized protein n=1 Tax=Austropuccinia psidii MF-1 TaxID=1389203 RepID=A0A9Q3BMX3_9BASI|nr:hypothetical protein [Austropuccinia psidii MF-1]
MLPTIWLFIFLCHLYEVNSSLAETSSLSHLKPVADLNLKCEAEPALVTSSRPGTPCEGQSKQKLKNLQISESCVKEDGSDIDNRKKAPMQPGRPFQPRPLKQGAVEQPKHSQKGTKYFNNLHQAEGSTFHHSPVPQTSNLRGPASVDTPHAPLIHWEPVYRQTWISHVTLAPVITPVVNYEPALFLDHYTPHIVPQHPPMHRNQVTGRASPIIPSQANHARQSREVSSFQEGIEKKIPSGTVTKSFYRPKDSKETCSPQLESISRATKGEEVRRGLDDSSSSLKSGEDLPSSLKNGEKDSNSPLKCAIRANPEINIFPTHNIVRQESENNYSHVSLAPVGAENALQEGKKKKSELGTYRLHAKSASNFPYPRSETDHSAPKSAQESILGGNVKLPLESEVNYGKTLSKIEASKEHTPKEHFNNNKMLKPVEKSFAEAQKSRNNVHSNAKTVPREKFGSENLNIPLNQRKSLFVQSNENSVDKAESGWIIVKRKGNRKDLQQRTQSSKDQKTEQVDLHDLSFNSPFALDEIKMPSPSELDKLGVRAQSKLHEAKLLSPEGSPTSSFPKTNNHVDENKEKVLHLSFESIDKQENKNKCAVKSDDKAQEASEMSSAQDKNTSQPRSVDLGERHKLPTEAGGRTQQKKPKKKGSNRNFERHDNANISNPPKKDLYEEIETIFEPSDSNVNHNSAPVPKRITQGPLPEPAFVLDGTPKTPDLWQSQLYASPVNLREISGPLRQKAELVLSAQWEKMEDMIFPEAFSPWTEGQATNEIYPGLPTSPLHSQSETKQHFEGEISQILRKHLKLSDESKHLTLEDLDEKVFKILRESWALDRKGFIAKLRETQRNSDDISEFQRRLYTLSRQILQYTIVENWKNIKGWLIQKVQFSKSEVEEMEKTFQLSTRFPDMKNLLNKNLSRVKRFTNNKDKITSMLQKVMGITETEIRVKNFQYLQQYSDIPAWLKQTDYMEQYKGNGLNIGEVFEIGESLSFGDSTFQFTKEKAADLLNRMQAIYVGKALKAWPWYVSPERAFLIKNFPKEYESRMKCLMDLERLHNNRRLLHATSLVHKTDSRQKRIIMLEYEDVWNFLHNGLTPQYMTQMYLAGVGRAKKNEKKWRDFIGRAHNLLTKEQSSLAINWFMFGNPIVKVLD